MRSEAAFKFIPELIGDISHTLELSKNPKMLYIETAVATLHMASDIFEALEEHINTNQRAETNKTLVKKYNKLQNEITEHYTQEAVAQLDITYEQLKIKIRNGQFRDAEVGKFIKCLKNELHRVIDIFKDVQLEPNNSNLIKAEELMRKSLRDYNNLIRIFIEEEEKDGQD